ncbi:hypothetical protein DE146DRAFT_333303 [Phaeosphaeria sp. MPI-PUGE-AT-0046c]|nr:hypothetical protein DE146DRAFT_333303 [Phaeosphaeria sp. MPI-PUGE-AT-0046c]
MEALAAVGLAGNIVQFIDFSCKLFAGASSIYHSHAGTLKGAQDLETITESLIDLSIRLEKSLEKQRSGVIALQNLKVLAKGCHDTAKELVTVLQSIRAKSAGSKWHSFRASLAGLLKESEIANLEKRINDYRLQLIIELQDLQQRENDEILQSLTSVQERGQQMGVALSDQISALRTEMKDALVQLVFEMKRRDAQQTSDQHQVVQVDVNALGGSLTHAEESGAALVVMLNIIDKLRFEGMSHRYTSVRKAHTGTFEWAFSNQLPNWLRSDDNLFWVTGKPGSGKSTLMKRLVDDPRTSQLLCEWSGARQPVVAHYFYWIKGTELQRSDIGLLRCILYDYLRQCPAVIAHVFPDLWDVAMARVPLHYGIVWRREDLMQAFCRLETLDTKSAHLCLFIDGLDEYQGDHQDLIETIQYLSRLKIKICVASRPWNIFEDTFGHLPQLRMQDLNKPDIQLYVRDKLFLRHDFQRARVATNDMDVIMSGITEKSQGVFLWVHLVVRSLVEGLRNSDPMSLLMKRLSSFPSDLNEFFRDMFLSLDPIYRNKTAKMFLLTMETMSPLYTKTFKPTQLTTLTHWYLDELDEHPDLSGSLLATDVYEDTIVHYTTTASLRINGRCKGLLEMIPGPYGRKGLQGQDDWPYWFEVTFLHRTVADFLETPDIQHMLRQWLEEDLDSWSLICQATLAEIRALAGVTTRVWSAVSRFLSAAALYEKTRGSTLISLLDELSKVLFSRDLCHPILFARLIIEYDLLIYVESSLSTQLWFKQTTSVLNGMGEAATAGKSTVLIPYLSGEMLFLIHSMSPKAKISRETQDLISKHARNKAVSDEAYVETIRKLSRIAYFDLKISSVPGIETRFASSDFHNGLISIVGAEQTLQLAENCLQPAGLGRTTGPPQRLIDPGKKEGKKSPFRRLFSRNR